MATREGNNIQHTKLLDNEFELNDVPNFNPPYPIENGNNLTKITLFKAKRCNKLTASLIVSIVLFLLILGSVFLMFFAFNGSDGGTYIIMAIYGAFAILPLLLIARYLSLICQYNKTEIYLDKKNNLIQVYESWKNNIYTNLNNTNCTGCCSCNRSPKITTICKLTDFDVVELDHQQSTSSNCCGDSRSMPFDKVKLKFMDIYSKKENNYFIQQSGKYADFTGCQYLNYIIQQNKNEIQI